MHEKLENNYRQRTKTPEQALSSLMRLCSRSEKSSGDAVRLMRRWGIDEKAGGGILEKLIRSKFIDDNRYAEAYVREKTGLSGWGPYKIRQNLKIKGIAPAIIERAVSGIEREKLHALLRKKLEKKAGTIKSSGPYDMKAKLVRYGTGLGYGYEDVIDAISDIIRD